MLRWRNLILLVVMAALCTGGSFTCRSGEDLDEDELRARSHLRIDFADPPS